jgi:Iron/zinc purple acid phosphatase-like protein C
MPITERKCCAFCSCVPSALRQQANVSLTRFTLYSRSSFCSCDGLYRSKCDRGGPIHLTIGTAGAHLDEADIGIFTNTWTDNVVLQTYGYGRITVKNESALYFEFVKAGNETDPTAGNVLDDVWILRDR